MGLLRSSFTTAVLQRTTWHSGNKHNCCFHTTTCSSSSVYTAIVLNIYLYKCSISAHTYHTILHVHFTSCDCFTQNIIPLCFQSLFTALLSMIKKTVPPQKCARFCYICHVKGGHSHISTVLTLILQLGSHFVSYMCKATIHSALKFSVINLLDAVTKPWIFFTGD